MKALALVTLLVSSFASSAFAAKFSCQTLSKQHAASAGYLQFAEIKGVFDGKNLFEASGLYLTDIRLPGYKVVNNVQVPMRHSRYSSPGKEVQYETVQLPLMKQIRSESIVTDRITLNVTAVTGLGAASSYLLWWHGSNDGGTFGAGQLYLACDIER